MPERVGSTFLVYYGFRSLNGSRLLRRWKGRSVCIAGRKGRRRLYNIHLRGAGDHFVDWFCEIQDCKDRRVDTVGGEYRCGEDLFHTSVAASYPRRYLNARAREAVVSKLELATGA